MPRSLRSSLSHVHLSPVPWVWCLPCLVSSLPFLLASPPCRLPRGGVGSVQRQIAGSWAKCQLPAPSSPPAPIFLPLWLVPLLSSPLYNSMTLISALSFSLPLLLHVLLLPNFCHFLPLSLFFHFLLTFLLLLFSSFHFFPILVAPLSFSHCPLFSPFLTAPFSLLFSLPPSLSLPTCPSSLLLHE